MKLVLYIYIFLNACTVNICTINIALMYLVYVYSNGNYYSIEKHYQQIFLCEEKGHFHLFCWLLLSLHNFGLS
jgi:hypothetical protein